jgi:hypothetical protein
LDVVRSSQFYSSAPTASAPGGVSAELSGPSSGVREPIAEVNCSPVRCPSIAISRSRVVDRRGFPGAAAEPRELALRMIMSTRAMAQVPAWTPGMGAPSAPDCGSDVAGGSANRTSRTAAWPTTGSGNREPRGQPVGARCPTSKPVGRSRAGETDPLAEYENYSNMGGLLARATRR